MSENQNHNATQSTFDEFDTVDVADDYRPRDGGEGYDGQRAVNAVTDFLHAEEGQHSDNRTYRVHSGSGATYAVDLDGPESGDGPHCSCDDPEQWCKHIVHVVINEEPEFGGFDTDDGGETADSDDSTQVVATDGGRDVESVSESGQSGLSEFAGDEECSSGVENCPGPNSATHIKDGKAVIEGIIPCVECYTESIDGGI